MFLYISGVLFMEGLKAFLSFTHPPEDTQKNKQKKRSSIFLAKLLHKGDRDGPRRASVDDLTHPIKDEFTRWFNLDDSMESVNAQRRVSEKTPTT